MIQGTIARVFREKLAMQLKLFRVLITYFEWTMFMFLVPYKNLTCKYKIIKICILKEENTGGNVYQRERAIRKCIHFIIDINDPGLFFPYQGSA